jgi:8-oxo-dGTP pyrophosphatase MutT (NUDIX family)
MAAAPDEDLVPRRAARVLLLDDAGRVLLLRGFDPARPDHRYWFTVGGGLDDGESMREAAVRELFEETGLRLAPGDLTGPVWHESTRFPFDGQWYEQRQDFFVAHTPGPTWSVDFSGLNAIEQASVDGSAWWSADEIEHTDEKVYPANLHQLLRKLTREVA